LSIDHVNQIAFGDFVRKVDVLQIVVHCATNWRRDVKFFGDKLCERNEIDDIFIVIVVKFVIEIIFAAHIQFVCDFSHDFSPADFA
jgi:hypothetical protein